MAFRNFLHRMLSARVDDRQRRPAAASAGQPYGFELLERRRLLATHLAPPITVGDDDAYHVVRTDASDGRNPAAAQGRRARGGKQAAFRARIDTACADLIFEKWE
jgi:hypothetical protein